MASVSTDANGNVRILFIDVNKKRQTIRVGKTTQKTANEIRLRVEHLHNALVWKLPARPGHRPVGGRRR